MSQRLLALVALVGTVPLAAQTGPPTPTAISRVTHDLSALAADSMGGRGVGSRGADLAADFIAAAFRAAGLEPLLRGGSYLHHFTVRPDAPAVAHTNLGGAAAHNVVGVLPGAGRPQAYVVIGAHYDHLGLGGVGSLDPDSTGVVHNGADDNASGTAALLAIARLLAGTRSQRSIVLIAFSGEELGLLGSASFVRDAPVPIDSIYAMLNLDMVGRLRDRKLAVFGVNTAVEFPGLLERVNLGYRFQLSTSGDGYGRSDHSSFYGAKRPVLHFFTGTHEDYHRTTDDWDKLNPGGVEEIARFVAEVATALADRDQPLTFVDAPPPQQTTGGGYGAYLGTVPDMTESPGGVRLTGVRAGSPAEAAGLKAGDIITQIGDQVIGNLYDMTDALRSHQPGDTVWIVAKRGDGEVRVQATLGRRGG